MGKSYRLSTICLAMLCFGHVVGHETDITSCPLFLKPAFELTEKDQVILDILQQEILNSKGEFASLTEVNGKYPEPFEKAFSCYLSAMGSQSEGKEKYRGAIKQSSAYIAKLLFPEPIETPQKEEKESIASDGECISLLIGSACDGVDNRGIDHVLSSLLSPQLGVKYENVIYMSDRRRETSFYPTKVNILEQFKTFARLVNQSKVGYFHYLGHGTYIKSPSDDQLDGQEDVYLQLVKALNSDVQLFIVADHCHDGTTLELPYSWEVDASYAIEHNALKVEEDILPQVVMLSSSKSPRGALTDALLKALKAHDYTITYRELLIEVNSLLSGIKLSSSYLLNIDDYYIVHKRL